MYTAVELKTTRSNAQEEEEPVNIAYGLYVSALPTAVFTNQNYSTWILSFSPEVPGRRRSMVKGLLRTA